MTESASEVPANWRDLQKAYEEKRRRWARKVNRPYSVAVRMMARGL